MKNRFYFLLLSLCLCMVGCNTDKDPKDPTTGKEGIANMDRYYVQVGEDAPMQLTSFKFTKGKTDEDFDITHYVLRVLGRSDTHTVSLEFTLTCNDSTMLKEGYYQFNAGMPAHGLTMCYVKYEYRDYVTNEVMYAQIASGGCLIKKEGEEYICDFNGKVERSYDASFNNAMKFRLTLTKELMTGESITAPYEP